MVIANSCISIENWCFVYQRNLSARATGKQATLVGPAAAIGSTCGSTTGHLCTADACAPVAVPGEHASCNKKVMLRPASPYDKNRPSNRHSGLRPASPYSLHTKDVMLHVSKSIFSHVRRDAHPCATKSVFSQQRRDAGYSRRCMGHRNLGIDVARLVQHCSARLGLSKVAHLLLLVRDQLAVNILIRPCCAWIDERRTQIQCCCATSGISALAASPIYVSWHGHSPCQEDCMLVRTGVSAFFKHSTRKEHRM